MAARSVYIRSIARAFGLLHAMNEKQPCSIAELQALTGLPKPTVFRILATLEHEGYVRNEGGMGRYRVTEKTRRLGAAYGEKSLLIDIGGPLALAVTRRIKWPLALGILDHDAIVVRYSSMPYSPLAVQSTTLGQRFGLLESAMGQAYLAHCSPNELAILRSVLQASAPEGTAVSDESINASVSEVRQRGYGLRLPRVSGASATMAVPILKDVELLGVLSMTTFGNLMTEKLVANYLPILRTTAQDIATAVAQHEAQLVTNAG